MTWGIRRVGLSGSASAHAAKGASSTKAATEPAIARPGPRRESKPEGAGKKGVEGAAPRNASLSSEPSAPFELTNCITGPYLTRAHRGQLSCPSTSAIDLETIRNS